MSGRGTQGGRLGKPNDSEPRMPPTDALPRWKDEPAVDHRMGDLDDLAVVTASVIPEQLERCTLVDAVTLHQDSLRPFDDGAPAERTFETVVLAEAQQHDLEGAFQRSLIGVHHV